MSDSKLSLPASLRAWPVSRLLFVGVAALIFAFIIIGTLTQSGGVQNEFNVGLGSQPFIVLAFLSFAGGLLSFVSPCTLPVLTAYFAFAFRSGRSQIAANTLAFMLGLGTTFSLFGAVGFAVGQILLSNQQLILLLGGALVVGFGVMSLLGQGFTGINASQQQPGQDTSLGGSYLFGLTFAVGWSSCVGPILGSVLTLAAQTSSVWQGMMLLFIYTLGLGLPLLVVSTFFGRMSRKSLFWRMLRGKGWDWDTHVFVVAAVWALAAWRVLAAFGEYAFRNFEMFAGQPFTLGHSIALLAVSLLGAVLWTVTASGDKKTTIHLHTTQLISGALFILMGILMLESQLSAFNNMIPPELAEWLAVQEERLINLFN